MKKNYYVAKGFSTMIFFGILAFILGFVLNKTPHVYTENMEKCMASGGEYSLHIEQDSSWNYERCEITKLIRY